MDTNFQIIYQKNNINTFESTKMKIKFWQGLSDSDVLLVVNGLVDMQEMSTGMKAKLKILMAMSHQAEILILDEPTSGLDVMAREGILDALRAYMEQEERAILISSHISGDLENLCDDL